MTTTRETEPSLMSNKAVVETLISAINEDDEATLRAVVDDDLVSHGALGDVRGPDGFVGIMLGNVRGGFPDAHVELVSLIEEGDLLSFRLDGSGTHLGPFLGVPPTGRVTRIRGIHHVRVRDRRIVEHWQGPDILAMLIDMGLFPPKR
ncbi:MAG: ester cyclase [Acidimicrobiales bacterium]